MAELHFAPLHSLLTEQALSPAQVAAVHLALLQRLLAGQPLSPVHAGPAVHFALLQRLLAGQAESLAQVGLAVHFAAVQTLLTPQAASSPQAFALHFTLVHTEPDELQSVSTEHREAAPHTTLPPQKAFVVQARPLLMPEGQVRVQVPLVAPQIPLSQSAAL